MENNSRYLRLELNQPTVISLRYIPGKPVTDSWNKPQILWITGDGRALYTPPVVADQLKELGIKPGQKFMLVKATREGRKGVEWSVSKLDAGASSSERPAPIPAGGVGNPTAELRASEVATNHQPGTSSDPDGAKRDSVAESRRPADTRISVTPSASGNPGKPSSVLAPVRGRVPGGHEANQIAGQAVVHLLTKTSLEPAYLDHPRPATEPTKKPPVPSSSRFAAALKTAVTAAAEAEAHGQTLNYNVRFSPEDIRAMGISVFIQGGAGGRNAA